MNAVQYIDEQLSKLEIGETYNVRNFTNGYMEKFSHAYTLTDDTFLCYLESTDSYVNGDVCIYRNGNLTVAEKRK